MKKLFALVLAAILILSAAAFAETELVFHTDPTTPGTDAGDLLENIGDFEEKTGYTVKFVETPYADIHQKLLTVTMAGGTDYDACFVETDFVTQLAHAGVLEPLDDYIAASDALNIEDYIPSVIERNTVDGVVYAIPQVADVQTMIYNSEILNELGIEAPETIEAFIEYCEKASAAGYIPLALRYDSSAIATQLYGLFLFTDGGSFVKYDEEAGKWVANMDNEIGQKWVENCRRIISTIDGDVLMTMDTTAMYDALNSGKAGATIAGAWLWDSVDEATGEKLVAAAFPKGSGNTVALMSGWNLAVFANSEKKDAAFELLEWKADPVMAIKTTAGLSGRADTEKYIHEVLDQETADRYLEFQALMQYGVGISPTGFTLRGEMTTALNPVFQEVVFSDSMSPADAAKLLNDTIQTVIDENA